jgi:hypothetical protein
MIKKLVTKVPAAPLALSLALTVAIAVLAACSTDTNSGNKEEEKKSSSSQTTYRPSSVATNPDVVDSHELTVSLSGTQRNNLEVVLQVRGNDNNPEVEEKGLAVVIKLNGSNLNNSDLGCRGKSSFQCDGIIPITAGLCGVFTVCYEVRLSGGSKIEAQDCKDLTRDQSFCAASSSSATPSSSSADNRRFEQVGGEISLNTATTNTCINLSSGTAGNEGNICLQAGVFAAQGNTSISVEFADAYGYGPLQTSEVSNPSSVSDFVLRNNPNSWFPSSVNTVKTESYTADQYYAVCTDGGPKADWTSNCYLMLPIGTLMTGGTVKVKVWKVQ